MFLISLYRKSGIAYKATENVIIEDKIDNIIEDNTFNVIQDNGPLSHLFDVEGEYQVTPRSSASDLI